MDGAIFDITERRAAEEALRAPRGRARRALQELRASRVRIVRAGDEARRRIERDLHDGAQDRLVAVALSSGGRDRNSPRAGEASARARRESARSPRGRSDELRELARGIHPAILTERGLGRRGAGARRPRDRAGRGRRPPGDRLPAPIEAAAYFVVAEALTNVAKYAQASAATVRVTVARGRRWWSR